MSELLTHPAFVAVREFADLMLRCGRDDYGPVATPLFAGQLNVETRRLPAGTPADPGLFGDNREIAGCGPYCQNLMYDCGLLDVLQTLTRASGDLCYDEARRAYLKHFLGHCRHPVSGYFPWGEHVGYDLQRHAIHQGDWKGAHEVKVIRFPWDQFWECDPVATRHEIEVAFYNHLCDEQTFAFNRHADMNGQPNRGRGPCSLVSSAAAYLRAWAWLAATTGETRFLDWAMRMNRLFWDARHPATDLFPTSEDRPTELWYSDVLDYACQLLWTAEEVGDFAPARAWAADLRTQALAYVHSFGRVAWDPAGPGFYDTLDITTGRPVIGPSKYYPDIHRPRHLAAWDPPDNSSNLIVVLVSAGTDYALTGDPEIREMYDRALPLVAPLAALAAGRQVRAGDAAGILFSLVHVARRSGEPAYLDLARQFATTLLSSHRRNGFLISGFAEGQDYYSARAGSNDLAAALLAFALVDAGRPELAPPLRNPLGTMPW